MGLESRELNRIITNISSDIDFSGVVHVKQGEEVLVHRAFGCADRSEERRNDIHTRFGIASGCKLFTAIGICMLVEQGKIDFHTPLADCLDIAFPHVDPQVTIHQLLTHTSGMPDYFDEEKMSDYEELWKDYPVYRIESLHDFLPLFQEEQMKFPPGERFRYNNAGYIVLGLILEQQTGRTFTEYIETEIFKPCGMMNSGYFSMDRLPRNTALGYIDEEEAGTWRTNIYALPKQGGSDGGAYTTAADMIKLWEALFRYELLEEETTNKLLHPHRAVNEEIHYGYGIWMNKKDGDIYKYHVMGYDPGVSFRASVYPGLDVKVVVPSNKESGPLEMTKGLEEILFAEEIRK